MPNPRISIIVEAIDKFSANFKKIGGSLDSVGNRARAFGQRMAGVSAAAGIAVAGIGAASVKAAIDFESSFAGVRKTVDATEEEFAQLAKNFRNLSKEIPVSVNELNRIGELAGQLGVSGVDNLTKFTETISKIAVTTNLTTESAATAFARIANVMQLPLDQVDKMGAAIVDLGNNFATTEADITEFSQRIAGAGKIAGLSVDEVMAIGTAMSSVGVQAEAGGTAVQKVLIAMTEAAATSGEQLGVFGQTAGMSAEEFKKAFQEDASAAFTQFVEGLGKQGDDAIKTLDELGLSDQRLIRSFLSLANAGDLLGRAMETSSSAFEENTALSAEAEKRFKTTASQLQILKNNLMDVAITVGEAFLPLINQIVEKVVPIVKNIGAWVKANPGLTKTIMMIVAAIGAFLAVLAPIGFLISGVATAIGALSGPIGIIIGIIAALGIQFAIMWDTFKRSVEVLKAGWEKIKQWFGEADITFSPVISAILNLVEAFKSLDITWQEFLSMAIDGVKNFVSTIVQAWMELPENIGFAIGMIVKAWQTGWQNLINFFTNTVPKFLFETIPETFTMFSEWWNTFWEEIKTKAVNLVMSMLVAIVEWFAGLPARIAQALSNLWGAVQGAFESFKSGAIDWAMSVADGIYNAFTSIPDRISGIFSGLMDRVRSFGSRVASGFRSALGRQAGGPVSQNRPYLVGERGPELFVPRQSGQIIPNQQISPASLTIGTINISNDVDANRFLRQMERMMGGNIEQTRMGLT